MFRVCVPKRQRRRQTLNEQYGGDRRCNSWHATAAAKGADLDDGDDDGQSFSKQDAERGPEVPLNRATTPRTALRTGYSRHTDAADRILT